MSGPTRECSQNAPSSKSHQQLNSSTIYAIEIFLTVPLIAFGTVIVRTPCSRLAVDFSGSTLVGKLKVREKDPDVLSEIQYLGAAGAPTVVSLLVVATSVVGFSAFDSLAFSSGSSSTVTFLAPLVSSAGA